MTTQSKRPVFKLAIPMLPSKTWRRLCRPRFEVSQECRCRIESVHCVAGIVCSQRSSTPGAGFIAGTVATGRSISFTALHY